ncbi:MAG: hypothetical protein IJT82_09250, partial [Schwartzia sp.]|nr:hypothetical protein [Schwartzia sp. (in: firmicutes)]
EKTDELQRAADDENWREVARLGTRLYYAGALPDDKIHMIAYAYQGMEDYGRTVFWCDRALEAQRGAGDLLFMKASALNLDGRLGESMSLCDAALDLMRRNHKEDGEFYLPFLRLKAEVAFKLGLPDASEYNKAAYENEKTIKGRLDSYSGYLLASHLREIDRDELFERHIGYAKIIDGEHIKQFTSYSHKSGGKIRVGYISPDFRLHVMFHFILPFFAAHDSGRFEVYAYRVGDEKEDKITNIFKSMAAQWRDVSMMSYADAANVIHEDGIDILFDLAGHSARSGLPVLAYRPAPVQISGIGYMATTGLKAVDCFLTDSFVDPEGLNDDYFTERLIRVTSHFCYSGVTNVAPSGGAPMKKKGYVTFGVFNHMRKYIENDRLLAAWREIMTLVPGARLLLKCQVYFSLTTIDFAYDKLKSAGIDMERVTFEPATVEYMSRYNDVDIALDTYPYPGGGTTCDALYMGVPVISLYGERHSTRFGYSLLNNVGIGELAVKSYEDYVARAVMLAGDEELLVVLHKKFRRMFMESPVMDSGRYMKEVEALYEGLYRAVQ